MVFINHLKRGLKKISLYSLNRGNRILKILLQDNQVIIFFNKDKSGSVKTANSDDGFNFKFSQISIIAPKELYGFPQSVIVPNFLHHGCKVMYFGIRNLKIAYLLKSGSWQILPKPIINSPYPTELSYVFAEKEALFVVYFEKKVVNKITYYATHLAFFDRHNPEKLLFKTEKPVFQTEEIWPGQKTRPLGSVFLNGKVITYWLVDRKVVWGVILSGFTYDPARLVKSKVVLKKSKHNPIIKPQSHNSWEAFNTFNPAALYAGGKVHLLYRAQGFDYVSVVGYAASSDGVTIEERLNQPIFTPKYDFDKPCGQVNEDYLSGGGIGGCEDPRLTLFGDRVYMTYVGFNSWEPPRLVLTSIFLKDFLAKRWLWSKPVLITPPGIIDKSGCLLSEKINGKYVFFHRVFPNILIDYVDDLVFDGKTKWLTGQYQIKIRPDKWDSRKIGVGAPPLKTKDGWLLIYYGVDNRDASKYHIGAMLLDLKDPTRVLYRTDEPILGPTEEYENTGFKPGIAYPCGAVIIGEELYVYYGGADSVVCVATAHLETFLEKLKTHHPIHLASVSIKEIVI